MVDVSLNTILRRYVDQVAAQLPGVRLQFMQSNGGLCHARAFQGKDSVLSLACFTQLLRVEGSGRGGKPREEVLKGQSLAAHAGKRARKGKPVEGLQKVVRLGVA